MVYDCDILTCTFACFARVENRYPPGSGAIINRSWSRSVYDCDAFGTSGNMAPAAFYSRISTNQLSTNQFFRLPAYHKEYARDISCSLLVPPIVVSKRNRRQERTAGTNGSRHGRRTRADPTSFATLFPCKCCAITYGEYEKAVHQAQRNVHSVSRRR